MAINLNLGNFPTISNKYYSELPIEFIRPAASFMTNLTENFTMQYGLKIACSPNPNRQYFVSAGNEIINIWEMDTWENKQRISMPAVFDLWFTSVSISPDGKTIATCKNDQINIWRLGEEKPTYSYSKNLSLTGFFDASGFDSVTFSPDGKILAANDKQEIKLWDVETGAEIGKLIGHSDKVTCVAFLPQNKNILASCSYDKTIKVWNIETEKELATLPGHEDAVYTIAFSPDGKILASGGDDRVIKLWPLETGEPRTLRKHSEAVTCLAFNPNGTTLISGSSDGTIQEWTITGKPLSTFPENSEQHSRGVTSVAFSPDGKTLISGGRDQAIKVWERNF